MTEELKRLIAAARNYKMTPEESRAQVISFAYGNLAVENPNITREMIECDYDRLYGSKHDFARAQESK